MAIARVLTEWTGFSGAPGYTNFYFASFGGGDSVDLEVARVRTFFDSIKALIPSDVVLRVQPEVAILEEASGALISYQQATTQPANVTGTSSAAWAGPAGAAITWNTEAIARGRRLRGRTFIVPMGTTAYQTDGTLATSAITTLLGAANALALPADGPQMVVWSRPRDGAGGTIGAVSSTRVVDKVAVLRSRRD